VHAATIQTGHDTLERDLKAMNDNYDKICSENRQLNALFTRQQKDKEKRRARDEALKEARDKARVEEEVRDKCDKRQQQDMQFEVLRLQTKSVKTHILGTFSLHFLTHFFLCMYTVIMVQRLFTPLNCTLLLDIHC